MGKRSAISQPKQQEDMIVFIVTEYESSFHIMQLQVVFFIVVSNVVFPLLR